MPYLIGLALTLGLFALYVASRPSAFRIERSLVIAAPASALYALINDLHAWSTWSPWEKMDPAMQKSFSGPDAGVGAKYHWVGPKSGEGEMTIIESVKPSKIEIDLRFIKPIAANNRTTFTVEPEGEGTRVTWVMEGNNGFVAKAFGVFMNMDAMVGKDFANGLAALRDAATKPA